MLTLKLFGTPAIESGDGLVTGRAAQGSRVALLALLALARGRAITRDKLTALLWPENTTERARHQLSDALYIVRGALGEDVVRSVGDELVLNSGVITSDAATFERLLDEGRLEEATEWFTGPLLDGFHLSDAAEFEHWLDAERLRLGQRYASALESLAEASEARHEFAAAVGWWRKLAAHDPHSGHIALRLMRGLNAAGDRAGALKHARAHAALLRAEFDAEPDAEVIAFAERLRVEPAVRTAIEPIRAAQPDATQPDATTMVAPTLSPASGTRRRRGYAAAAGVLVLVLVVFGVYALPGLRPGSPAARTLGVLPFVNLSADPENAYFSDGLSEEIITTLSRISGLRVAARTSSFALRDRQLDARAIGDTLGVEAVLEGSVRKDGQRLRVTAQLIDAASGYHIWSEEYDRELADIFAVQQEIATAIAHALELRPPGQGAARRDRRMRNLEAYDLYLRGLYLRNSLTGDALRQARAYFDRAIALEPGFALAHAAKASVIAPMIYFSHTSWEQGVRDMRVEVARALELDPELGEAHAALGILRLYFDWDWAGAERAFRRAVELNPNDPHAHHMVANYLRAMNRAAEAVIARAHSLELDPLNARTAIILANDYVAAGEFEQAILQYERARKLDPVHPLALGLGPSSPSSVGNVYSWQGRHQDALEEYLRIATLRGATARELDAMRDGYARDGMSGFWRGWIAMDLRQSSASADPLRIACEWALAGDTAQAFHWLERAYAERNPGLVFLRSELAFQNYLAHPRVARIVKQMKFPGS